MKTKIFCCVLAWVGVAGLTYGQIRSDFVLISGGYDARLAFDREGRLHTAWFIPGDTLGYKWLISYGLFDSLGYAIEAPKILVPYGAQEPNLAVGTNYSVVVWRRVFATDSRIIGRILTIAGDTATSDVKFSENVGDVETFNPDVAFLNDSTFIVVWSHQRTPEGIYGQLATTSGRLIGDNLLLSDHTASGVNHTRPRVLSHPSSEGFLVVWINTHLGGNKVFGRFFLPDGAPKTTSFLISEDPELTDASELSVTQNPLGGFAVVWRGIKNSLGQVQSRRFDVDGTPLNPSEKVNTKSDAIVTSNIILPKSLSNFSH
jgi:hypothetical protein